MDRESLRRLGIDGVGIDTPALFLDLDVVKDRIQHLRSALPGWGIYYAIKALPHDDVVRLCLEGGIGFEVASRQELSQTTIVLGARPERIISGNTVKTGDFIRTLVAAGIRTVAVDSEPEIERLAKAGWTGPTLVRLTVSNDGSKWPLDKRFGQPPEVAQHLLERARALGLKPAGVTFHVGSQCLDPGAFDAAFGLVFEFYESLIRSGIRPSILNAGGGLPVRGVHVHHPIAEFLTTLRTWEEKFQRLIPGIELQFEPGRFLVGEAGALVTRVIGKTSRVMPVTGEERGRKDWLVTDLGVFSGLADALGGFEYKVEPLHDGATSPLIPYHIAGPSCDSVDVWGHDVLLPEKLAVGDLLVLPWTGAYTVCYASNFNGLPTPCVRVIGADGRDVERKKRAGEVER